MLSVPLMLFRGKDAERRVLLTRFNTPKRASDVWLGQFLAGFGIHLAPPVHKSVAGDDHDHPSSSPCPSSSSSDSSSSSSVSPSSSSSDSTSDSEDEAPPPPANNNGNGGGGDDRKEEKEEEEDDNNRKSSSSSDSSAEESDPEEDTGALLDTDDEKDMAHNGIDPTDDDDDVSGESDGSSDLESSYPRLPWAPVDALINFRQQAAHKELQLTEKLKQEVVADARERHQKREQAQRSKKKKRQTPKSKRRHSKSDVVPDGFTHLEGHRTNGSTNVVMASPEQEKDEWMVDCSCGLKEKNYDDGTSMIQCDSCTHWVHAKCANKHPEAVAQEKFLCFRCSWMFDCVCSIRRRPNHDDGQRMVECESCKTWQHTMCVGIPMTEEPADDYRCPRCVKKSRRRKSASKGSRSRQRQRSRADTLQHDQQSTDVSPLATEDARSLACSLSSLPWSTRTHGSKRAEAKELSKLEKKASVMSATSPPPVPAVSPPSTPPPPSSPPPSHPHSESIKRDPGQDHIKRRSERERARSSAFSSLSHRKRGRSLGTRSSSVKKTRSGSSDMEHHATPPSAVTPSPRGKGLMLQGYSSAADVKDASSSRSMDGRSRLPLTPPSIEINNGNNNNSHSRKRKVSSARDRLAKKLRMRKSSLR